MIFFCILQYVVFPVHYIKYLLCFSFTTPLCLQYTEGDALKMFVQLLIGPCMLAVHRIRFQTLQLAHQDTRVLADELRRSTWI